jgi:hypothetical protein
MFSAQPTQAVTANANGTSKKRVNGADSFARALGEGLIDVAFSFDGAFRPFASMSLAERAAYGLRSNHQTVTHPITSAAAHVFPGTLPNRQLVSSRPPRPLDASLRVIGGPRKAFAAPPPPTVDGVRREARLRHASSSDGPPKCAAQHQATGFPGLRVAAKVGPARLDVIVAGRGRLASVMQWMR